MSTQYILPPSLYSKKRNSFDFPVPSSLLIKLRWIYVGTDGNPTLTRPCFYTQSLIHEGKLKVIQFYLHVYSTGCLSKIMHRLIKLSVNNNWLWELIANCKSAIILMNFALKIEKRVRFWENCVGSKTKSSCENEAPQIFKIKRGSQIFHQKLDYLDVWKMPVNYTRQKKKSYAYIVQKQVKRLGALSYPWVPHYQPSHTFIDTQRHTPLLTKKYFQNSEASGNEYIFHPNPSIPRGDIS